MNGSARAVVLVSGGLDSATVLAIALSEGYSAFALTFDYGQRHDAELAAARRIAASYHVADHKFFTIDLRTIGGSALTDDLPVPKHDKAEAIGTEIPVTYVPARNTIFLSVALAWAEVVRAEAIFLGINALDYSGYPDCRPEFVSAFQAMANVATKRGVEGHGVTIRAPLLNQTKTEIIRQGLALEVDYSQTVSCYDPSPDGLACRHCDACLLRLRGFAEAGKRDPARYM